MNQEEAKKIRSGQTIKVHQKIKEGDKERVQIFEGIVLAKKGGSSKGATILVRKVSEGIGVEKIFPIFSPIISKIEIVKQARVKKSRPYYLRNYQKRLKEKKAK